MSLAASLSCYVPTDRLHAIVAQRELPSEQTGAVLQADISGFTPLTEQLVRAFGPRRGGEELTRHVNAAYGALLDLVHAFHGSVVGFSGDGVTCWFPDDDGTTAVACGLRLHEAMRAAAGADLAIKVAIAAGRARRFLVGDPRLHVMDVLCGSLVDRVARGEALAARGELVVGGEVVAAAAGRCKVARWAAPDDLAVVTALAGAPAPVAWPALPADALDEDQLRSWLLPAVYERLRSGQSEYLAELRQAVPLFLRFEGLDFEHDPDVGAKLDTFVRWVQGVLERHSGALVQLTTGDKGSYLYAVFGAPIALEDAGARAIEAALTLRAPPESAFVIPTRIGISRGQLRTGAYGSARRRTYGALGDETNVAARLMMMAEPGQVLASQFVVRSAGADYEFNSLGEVALKGKQQRVPVRELVGRATVQRRRRQREPILGRDRERALVQAVLDRVAAGEPGHSIIVSGDPGIGKSRLVGDLLDRARKLPDTTCAITAGIAVESAVPYHAFGRVLSRVLGLPEPFDRDQARARVLAVLPPLLRPFAPLLNVVLPLDLPDTPAIAELPAGMRAAQTRRFVVRLLDELAGKGPLVLVIEDAHCLDSASWAVVLAAREQIGRLLLVLTLRPGPTEPPPLRQLAELPTTHTIRLAGLPPAELVALVARRLGIAEVPPEVAELAGQRAEGNPFFAEELVTALRETGLIEIAGGACRVLAPLDALPFPETIEGVVTSRIDRLPPNEQLTLKVASVLGRAFQLAPLQDVFPVVTARELIPDYVDALSRQDLATRDDSAAGTYTFKHAITQDIAYNLMLFEQRRALHAQLADWYDDAVATDLAVYAVRAYHRVKAIEGLASPGEPAIRRTLDAVLEAGRRATATGATTEGIAYFEQARELVARLPESRQRSAIELDVCSWLCSALAVVKGPAHPDVVAELARARALCDIVGDRSRLFEALFNQWYTHHTGSERDGALEFSRRLLELARDSGDDVMTLLAQHARGATLISIGEHREGMELMRSALAIARRTSREAIGALAHARNPTLACHLYIAWACWFLGYPDTAIAETEQAVAIAKAAAHPLNLAQAHCFAAIAHRFRREIEPAERHVDRALAIASEHGFPYWMTVAVAVRAWTLMAKGEVATAVAQLEALARHDREARVYPLVWIIARAVLIEGLTRLDRLDDALAIAEEAKLQGPARLLGFGLPEIHRLEAEVWRARGDTDRARACFERAVAVARAQDAKSLELRAELGYARLDPARRDSLARVYAWFEEGLGTPDLVAARELLAGGQAGLTPGPTATCDLDGVKAYVLGRLARELAPELTYHCLEHTRDDVLPAALELAARHQLSATDTTLLATAALFHDLGFIECANGHEQVGARIAAEVLPGFGYTPQQIETVVGIIMATRLPQSPHTLLEQLMADADLDVLGRDDFFDKNDALRQEWASQGLAFTRESWYAQQLEFFRRHTYFTPIANAWRGSGKARNIAELERRLMQARGTL